MKWICRIFGHHFVPHANFTNDLGETKVQDICTRCGKLKPFFWKVIHA